MYSSLKVAPSVFVCRVFVCLRPPPPPSKRERERERERTSPNLRVHHLHNLRCHKKKKKKKKKKKEGSLIGGSKRPPQKKKKDERDFERRKEDLFQRLSLFPLEIILRSFLSIIIRVYRLRKYYSTTGVVLDTMLGTTTTTTGATTTTTTRTTTTTPQKWRTQSRGDGRRSVKALLETTTLQCEDAHHQNREKEGTLMSSGR